MGWNGDVGRRADDLVGDAPFVIDRVAFGEVEGTGDDADGGVGLGEVSAKVLDVGPVVAVEAQADLGAHVGEHEGRVHGLLAPFGVCGRDLVAAVVAAAGVVGEFGAEGSGEGGVFVEGGLAAGGVVEEEGGWGNVLGYEVGGAEGAVVCA